MKRLRLVASVGVLIVFFPLGAVWLWDQGCRNTRPDLCVVNACRAHYLKWKYDYRIRRGMTLAEVEAIIGESSWVHADGWQYWDREEIDGIDVVILFENGRVSKKKFHLCSLEPRRREGTP